MSSPYSDTHKFPVKCDICGRTFSNQQHYGWMSSHSHLNNECKRCYRTPREIMKHGGSGYWGYWTGMKR